MRLIKGTLRELTGPEKLTLGVSFSYVTTSEFYYQNNNCHITIPRGFLTNYSSLLIFYDYLYATHPFTREQADKIAENIVKANLCCLLFIKLSQLNLFWLSSTYWRARGNKGAQIISYELKKDI